MKFIIEPTGKYLRRVGVSNADPLTTERLSWKSRYARHSNYDGQSCPSPFGPANAVQILSLRICRKPSMAYSDTLWLRYRDTSLARCAAPPLHHA